MKPLAAGNLYEQVACNIAEAVNRGVYMPGERVPSVRQLSNHLGVSIATVIQAYQLLADRGLVEARPQSGYYVSARTNLPQPRLSNPELRPFPVATGKLAISMLQGSKDHDFVQLAAAVLLTGITSYPPT